MLEAILTAVIPVVIIGIICGAVLVIASKLMAVKEDERFPKIRECLPGANCGACGFAGCDGYAKALCEKEGTPTHAAYIGRVISLSVTYSVCGNTAPNSTKVENMWAAG